MWKSHTRSDKLGKDRWSTVTRPSIVDVPVDDVLHETSIAIYDFGHSHTKEWLNISTGNSSEHRELVELSVKPTKQQSLSSPRNMDCSSVISSGYMKKSSGKKDVGRSQPHLIPRFKLGNEDHFGVKSSEGCSFVHVNLVQPSNDSKSEQDKLRGHRVSSTDHDEVVSEGVNDVEVCDLSDAEIEEISVAPATSMMKRPSYSGTSRSITLSEAMKLKQIVVGSPFRNFSPEWYHQSFTFSNHKDLMYGLIQRKGGPCGIVAAVQAYIILHLVFGDVPSCLTDGKLRPSIEDRNRALVLALSTILWRAGQKKRAVVTVISRRMVFDTCEKLKTDGIIEKLILKTFESYDDLVNYLYCCSVELQAESSNSCITFLYSAILSRGIDRVVKDMDDPSYTLVGRQGYCTQEMVNLFLTGKAVSNVFNGTLELGKSSLNGTTLHGIPDQSDIGFLSLFEHYQSCEVGSHLKNPRNPIWIVLSESHFSVLFATCKEVLLVNKDPFHLFYYDGLSRQDEEICLTIDPRGEVFHDPDDSDFVPPLELCIHTRWKEAAVNWNGTDPLL
ncbi:putative ubiquitin carboxyl-terminal hydrolase MINDY-4 isoform X1 [Tachypleus tridentatus]|uniref:putative ubiquitin carboxyl-terminal hydrolase MINDY-4 isoform X1 n=1 Tax=Tachypleus tridentatus TaxID=6853 RepID=UPI003FD108A2